jgi:TolB-like protein
VLPLKNYSGNPDQEYFSDGMTEELTTTLAKIEALRVIAHQSVLQFKRSERPLPEIARALDVKYVVDGSVLQDGDSVRITANLIDAAKNTHLWSDSFRRARRDVMALQREVALAIALAIEVALTPQDRARLAAAPQVNPKAFDLYVRGTQARYQGNFTGDFTQATTYLERAIAEDSGYAPAYAGLAFIHTFEGDEAGGRRFADRAVRLDPQLADAQMVVGVIREFFDWDWPGAQSAFEDAIRSNPGHAEAHHELGMLLMRRKRFDEALREVQKALYLAPTSTRFENGIGEVYVFSGRYDEALGTARKLLAIDSSFIGGYYLRGLAYEQLGKPEEAVEAWQKCLRLAPVGCAFARARLAYIDAMAGRRAEALRVVDTLKARWQREKRRTTAYDVAENLAIVYAGLGERKEALDWLERATESGAFMLYTDIEPNYHSLRAEPRFQAVLKKLGLDGT